MNRRDFFVGAGASVLINNSRAFSQECGLSGRFNGPLRTLNISADGRRRRLAGDFSYTDKCGKVWEVPAGTPLDGASIPPIFWPVVGRPWEGAYVNASVIHDYGCYRRIEFPRTVHRLFHEAMLASGVSPAKARLMFLAVLYGGPTWDWATVDANRQAAGLLRYPPPPAPPPPPSGFAPPPRPGPISAERLQSLAQQVEDNDLELRQIEVLADLNRPS